VCFLAYFGDWALRWILHLFNFSIGFNQDLLRFVFDFLDWRPACAGDCNSTLATLSALRPSAGDTIGLAICGVIFTYLIGVLNYAFREKEDDPKNW
jgi:hypothetical protein